MKIAICGAHGVGKTTIATNLQKHINHIILPDIVVDAYKLGFSINENTSLETQIWLLSKQLENEKTNKDFIADKCLFDYYVYADVLNMDKNFLKIAKDIVLKNGKYDTIFFIRPEFPIEDDGIRSTNIEFQTKISSFYENFLILNNIQYFILTGSVENRINQCLKAIKNKKNA